MTGNDEEFLLDVAECCTPKSKENLITFSNLLYSWTKTTKTTLDTDNKKRKHLFLADYTIIQLKGIQNSDIQLSFENFIFQRIVGFIIICCLLDYLEKKDILLSIYISVRVKLFCCLFCFALLIKNSSPYLH